MTPFGIQTNILLYEDGKIDIIKDEENWLYNIINTVMIRSTIMCQKYNGVSRF